MSSKRPNVATAVYLLLVFLSGVLVGVFAYRLYNVRTVQSSARRLPPRNPEEYRQRVVAELTARLKLTQDQVGKLHQIMDETRQRYREVREKQRPELKEIEDAQHQGIRAMLNETQLAEYERMRAERERRREAEKRKLPQ
jgi:hypothetical protein